MKIKLFFGIIAVALILAACDDNNSDNQNQISGEIVLSEEEVRSLSDGRRVETAVVGGAPDEKITVWLE